MEAGEIDERVRCQEEVWNDRCDCVEITYREKIKQSLEKTEVHDKNGQTEQAAELTNDNEGHGNEESEDVSTDWFVVLAVALGEEVQSFVDVVLAQGLEDFGSTDEGGQSGREGGGECTSNDEGPEPGH